MMCNRTGLWIQAAIASCVVVGAGGWQQAPAPATTPATASSPTAPVQQAKWYENEIRAFEAQDKASMAAPGGVLFIGSSSVRMWTTLAEDMKPAPVLNRGFGGSQTKDVLEVFDRIVLPYKPSVIVYYCGDNDLGTENKDSQAPANGFIEFDKKARAAWPHVQVMYIAIKPSIARWKNWPAMEKANTLVREYCEKTPGAMYLDIATPMLGETKTLDPALFKEDGLHLSDKGYAMWTAVVRPAVLKAWEAGKSKQDAKPETKLETK